MNLLPFWVIIKKRRSEPKFKAPLPLWVLVYSDNFKCQGENEIIFTNEDGRTVNGNY